MLPPLPSKPLAELTEADLLRLVEDEVREDVEIDYKARLETDSQEFAKDVSSFANTKGGYLVYGMTEDRELPTGLVALDGFDPSTVIGRFNSWAQEHIRPRLTLRFQPVTVEGGGSVLVVEVPRSWVGPHQVRQDQRFYHRTQHGKAPMDVDQIRQAFAQDRGLFEAIEDFQNRRIHFRQTHTRGLGAKCSLFLLHLLPADGILGRRRVDLTGTAFGGYYPVPHPTTSQSDNRGVWRGSTGHLHNLEGYAFQEYTGAEGEACACQVFRNGAVEHKWASRAEGDKRTIYSQLFDQWLYRATLHAVSVIKSLESQGPIVVVGSLIGAHGWDWPFPNFEANPCTIDEPELRLPEVMLESTESSPGVAAEQLSNYLWNAMGRERSPNFQNGEFKPR